MSDKFTPGPWRVEERRDQCGRVTPPYFAVVIDDRRVIADTLNADDVFLSDETEANARLVAAAPDLLAVAKDWLDHFDCLTDDSDSPEIKAMYLRLHGKRVEATRAAIAKATGK